MFENISRFKYKPTKQRITKLSKRQQQKGIKSPQKTLNNAKNYKPTSPTSKLWSIHMGNKS